MKKGMVYLIGAGSGDAGLFTIKGKAALEKADMIIYDFLVNPKILKYAGDNKKSIYVGKSGASHTMEQEDINKLLEREARKGCIVARLKGGDPFVFGRGGEEAEHLFNHKIPFEIIPGISSAIAGPAYAGIPVTHRGLSSAFTVMTGHKRGKDEKIPDIDYKKAANKDSTLVILMGLKNLSKLADMLIKNGMPKNMPAAIISWATYNKQKTIVGKLSNIAEKAKQDDLAPPTVIVIGHVVSMREKLKWFEVRPLSGKKIMVTRTRKQASAMTSRLEELGAEVIEFPTIEFKELPDSKSEKQIFGRLNTYDYIVFTSQNGVDVFSKKLFRHGKDSRSLCGAKICAIGSETAKELEKIGLIADIIPKQYVAEGLLASFPKNIKGKKILIMRAKDARDILPRTLSKNGAKVQVIPLYKTLKPKSADSVGLKDVDIVTVTSSSCANNFIDIFKGKDLSNLKFASIGPITSKTVEDAGYNVWVEANIYTIEGLVAALVKKIASSSPSPTGRGMG